MLNTTNKELLILLANRIKEGNFSQVLDILEHNKIDLNQMLEKDGTILIVALKNVKFQTPGEAACNPNIFDVVKMLIKNGADPAFGVDPNGKSCGYIVQNALELLNLDLAVIEPWMVAFNPVEAEFKRQRKINLEKIQKLFGNYGQKNVLNNLIWYIKVFRDDRSAIPVTNEVMIRSYNGFGQCFGFTTMFANDCLMRLAGNKTTFEENMKLVVNLKERLNLTPRQMVLIEEISRRQKPEEILPLKMELNSSLLPEQIRILKEVERFSTLIYSFQKWQLRVIYNISDKSYQMVVKPSATTGEIYDLFMATGIMMDFDFCLKKLLPLKLPIIISAIPTAIMLGSTEIEKGHVISIMLEENGKMICCYDSRNASLLVKIPVENMGFLTAFVKNMLIRGQLFFIGTVNVLNYSELPLTEEQRRQIAEGNQSFVSDFMCETKQEMTLLKCPFVGIDAIEAVFGEAVIRNDTASFEYLFNILSRPELTYPRDKFITDVNLLITLNIKNININMLELFLKYNLIQSLSGTLYLYIRNSSNIDSRVVKLLIMDSRCSPLPEELIEHAISKGVSEEVVALLFESWSRSTNLESYIKGHSYPNVGIVKLFLSRNSDFNSIYASLRLYMQTHNPANSDIVKSFLNRIIAVNKDGMGMAVMLAIDFSLPHFVCFYLDQGVNPNVRLREQACEIYPLRRAFEISDYEIKIAIITALVMHGLDLRGEVLDKEKFRLLYAAGARNFTGVIFDGSFANCYIPKDADISVADMRRVTAANISFGKKTPFFVGQEDKKDVSPKKEDHDEAVGEKNHGYLS